MFMLGSGTPFHHASVLKPSDVLVLGGDHNRSYALILDVLTKKSSTEDSVSEHLRRPTPEYFRMLTYCRSWDTPHYQIGGWSFVGEHMKEGSCGEKRYIPSGSDNLGLQVFLAFAQRDAGHRLHHLPELGVDHKQVLTSITGLITSPINLERL